MAMVVPSKEKRRLAWPRKVMVRSPEPVGITSVSYRSFPKTVPADRVIRNRNTTCSPFILTSLSMMVVRCRCADEGSMSRPGDRVTAITIIYTGIQEARSGSQRDQFSFRKETDEDRRHS